MKLKFSKQKVFYAIFADPLCSSLVKKELKYLTNINHTDIEKHSVSVHFCKKNTDFGQI